MTIQSLRYIIQIAKYRSLSLAARSLFVSQSTLSVALNDLENELGVKLFNRTNHGAELTMEGIDFIPKARQIVDSADNLLESYREKNAEPLKFSVVSQRFAFATRAFNSLMQSIEKTDDFIFSMKEDTATNLIKDIIDGNSELGVTAIQEGNIQDTLKDLSNQGLQFVEISRLPIVCFVRKGHPLARNEYLKAEDLLTYTYVVYNSDYSEIRLADEIPFNDIFKKRILTSDRSTKISLIRNNDFFALGADLPNSRFAYAKSTGVEIVAIPFRDSKGHLISGYIKKSEHALSALGREYVKFLSEEIDLLKRAERFYNTLEHSEQIG